MSGGTICSKEHEFCFSIAVVCPADVLLAVGTCWCPEGCGVCVYTLDLFTHVFWMSYFWGELRSPI